jgi:hypothetical protein
MHDTDTRDVLYPGRPPYELRVEFSKDGNVTGVFAFPGFDRTKFEALGRTIREELTDSTGRGFGQRVLFSLYPVQG